MLWFKQLQGMRLYREVLRPGTTRYDNIYDAQCPDCKWQYEVCKEKIINLETYMPKQPKKTKDAKLFEFQVEHDEGNGIVHNGSILFAGKGFEVDDD